MPLLEDDQDIPISKKLFVRDLETMICSPFIPSSSATIQSAHQLIRDLDKLGYFQTNCVTDEIKGLYQNTLALYEKLIVQNQDQEIISYIGEEFKKNFQRSLINKRVSYSNSYKSDNYVNGILNLYLLHKAFLKNKWLIGLKSYTDISESGIVYVECYHFDPSFYKNMLLMTEDQMLMTKLLYPEAIDYDLSFQRIQEDFDNFQLN